MTAIDLSHSKSTPQACFSFTKVPVPLCPPKILPSSGGATLRLHSNISDIIPSRPAGHPRSGPFSAAQCEPVLVDDDYDNHIRFPRISNLRNYVHTNTPRKLLVGQISSHSSQGLDSKYTPATFDLAAPLRRYSVAEEIPRDASILEYVADNYMYTRGSLDKLEKLTPQRVRNNPSVDLAVTVLTAACDRASISSGKWSSTGLYEMKKPLIMPAVLRRNDTSVSLNAQLDARTLQDLKSYRVTTEEPIDPLDPVSSGPHSTAATFSKSSRVSSVKDMMEVSPPPSFCGSRQRKSTFTTEPTHAHWQSNCGSKNHCTRCLKTFHGALWSRLRSWWDMQPSIVDSKHHCRFCGFMVCRDCLAQSELSHPEAHEAIVLDEGARFVVPMHTPGETEHPLANPENYNLVKICKHCAQMYRHVIDVLNELAATHHAHSEPERGAHVFIENPHIAKMTQAYSNPQPHVIPSDFKRQSVAEEWTWSSF